MSELYIKKSMQANLEVLRLKKMSQDLDIPENLKSKPTSYSPNDVHDLAINYNNQAVLHLR